MEQILNKAKELKSKVLDILEAKLGDSLTIAEISTLVDCLDKISDDKNFYNLKLVEALESLKKANTGYSGISLESE